MSRIGSVSELSERIKTSETSASGALPVAASDLIELNALTQVILRASDLPGLLEEVTLQLAGSTGASGGYACVWDQSESVPRLMFESGDPPDLFDQWELAPAGPGFSRRALSQGEPVVITRGDDGFHPIRSEGTDRRVEAALIIPLQVEDLWLGSIVLAMETTRSIPEARKLYFEQVSGQLSLAVSKVQALEGERRRSNELEGLRRASLGLTSNLDLETVLDSILESTLDLVEADDAHIFLFDEEELIFGAARWANDEDAEPYPNPRQNGLTYSVARSGEPIVIPRVDEHPIYAEWQWGGAIAGLPLKIGERVVGVMNIALMHEHEFDEAELRGLRLLADQAAVMIQNARLFERVVRERRNVELVYEVAQELAISFDQDEILTRALASTVEHLSAHSGEIFLLDEDGDHLRLKASSRRDGLKLLEEDEPFNLQVGRGLIGWIAEHRESVLVEDVESDDRWMTFEGIDEDVRTALGTPLISGGTLLGVMGVFQTSAGAFRLDHLHLLDAIARQVSLALSNAQRYEALERRIAEMSVVREVIQVVNQRLEMESLLEEVVHQVGEVVGYPVVEVYLVEGAHLKLGAAHGGPMDMDTRYLITDGVLGRVARSGEPAFLPDVRDDPDYIEGWADTCSEIAVPLRKGDVIVGVINVESPSPYGLNEDDLRLLNVLADQISIAIENAALYDRLREHADALELMVAERTAELAEALNKAQEADQLKTAFVSDVSHELRTPLSNIRLYLDLLRRGPETRFEGYMQTLDRETNRLVALIEDLLAISSLDAGTATSNVKMLDLNKLAEGLAEDRSRLYSDRDLALDLDLEPDLPAVFADEKMISQVVANLMTNALNYTPQGGNVGVRTSHDTVDGELWSTLSVQDDGLGIPESELDRIFDRFFRGSISRQTGTPGTGLGLSICKEILERHNGRITVESKPGEGSTFKIWLPAERAQ